jgi:hypothetical protein
MENYATVRAASITPNKVATVITTAAGHGGPQIEEVIISMSSSFLSLSLSLAVAQTSVQTNR